MRAQARLSASVVFTEPVVISSDSMKDNKPVNLKGGRRSARAKRSAKRRGHGHCRNTPRGVPLSIDVSFIFREGRAEALTEAG